MTTKPSKQDLEVDAKMTPEDRARIIIDHIRKAKHVGIIEERMIANHIRNAIAGAQMKNKEG